MFKFRFLCVLLFLVFFGALAFAANTCNGTYCVIDSNVTSDTTWIDGNTYLIANDQNTIYVTGSGVDLNIQAGAVVKLKKNGHLIAAESGKIIADGNSTDNILFTSCKDQASYTGIGVTNADTSTEAGCSGSPATADYNVAIWIKSDSGMTTSDNLSYLRILYPNAGIHLDEDINAIHDSNISLVAAAGSLKRRGVYIPASSAIKIHNNFFGQFSGASLNNNIIEIETGSFSGNIYSNTFFNDTAGGAAIKNTFSSGTFSGSIYGNTFRTVKNAISHTNGTFSGSIYSNDFNNMSGTAITITNGTFSGNIYSNDFNNSQSTYIINIPAGTFSGNIYSNDFNGVGASGNGIYTTASTFSGSIYNNTFSVVPDGATAIITGAADFSGGLYNNIFSDVNGSWAIYLDGPVTGSIYNNLFKKFFGTSYGIDAVSGTISGHIYNNTFAGLGASATAIVNSTGTLSGNIQRNLFVNTGTALSGTLTGTVSNNGYFQVTTAGGSAGQHASDQNSASGFTADPFIGDNTDRNFLLNTTSSGGAKLVNAGGVDVNSFYQARTTQLSNALDRGTVDIGYHYDQNAMYLTVLSPSDSNILRGTQSIDFNIENGFGTTGGITAALKYSPTTSGGTSIVSQLLSSYTCSVSTTPFFTCTYPWDTTTTSSDGNYYIVFTASDANLSGSDSSNNSFMVDSNAPTTTSDANSSTWQAFDANVHLTCTDSNSGCSLTQFRLDTNALSGASFGSWQTYDRNILITSDGNWAIDFNSSDVAGNIETTKRAYALVDKTAPSTTSDANSSWQKFDANVHLTCVDINGSGCGLTRFRLDANGASGVSMGAWQTYDTNILIKADGNWAVDFNSSDSVGNLETTSRIYVLRDTNGPTVTITSPSNDSTTTSSTVDIAYSGTDTNSGIAKYWVSSDGTAWTDNSLNTSYSFTGQSNALHTYYVKATDNADNNSANADVNVTVSVPSTSTSGGGGYPYCSYYFNYGADICDSNQTCPGTYYNASDTQKCCSVTCVAVAPQEPEEEEAPEAPVVEQQLFSVDLKYDESLIDEGLPIIEQTQEAVKTDLKRWATASDVHFNRKIRVFQFLKGTTVDGYKVSSVVEIENVSGKDLSGFELIEEIPKELASSASLITSDLNFEVIQEDPILKFFVGSLSENQKKSISYDFVTSSGKAPVQKDFEKLKPPVALLNHTEGDACLGVFCNDFNECTLDICRVGECEFFPKSDGATCGDNLVCMEGNCVEKPAQPPKEPESPQEELPLEPTGKPVDASLGIIVVLVLIALAAVGYFYLKKPKKLGK